MKMIAINRPHKKNAVDSSTAKALHDAFTVFGDDPKSKVAVLYGKGNHLAD